MWQFLWISVCANFEIWLGSGTVRLGSIWIVFPMNFFCTAVIIWVTHLTVEQFWILKVGRWKLILVWVMDRGKLRMRILLIKLMWNWSLSQELMIWLSLSFEDLNMSDFQVNFSLIEVEFFTHQVWFCFQLVLLIVLLGFYSHFFNFDFFHENIFPLYFFFNLFLVVNKFFFFFVDLN